MSKFVLLLVFICVPRFLYAQGFIRHTYHDPAKKNLKEAYYVKDTISNILNGPYVSYFLNGNVESRGQFLNHETTGNWEFYYETGKVKMRGILRQNSNYGHWEYFFENGARSMEGNINEKNKEGEWKIYYESGNLKESGEYKANKRSGLWKTFFEDGTLRGEIEYNEDHGRYTEYFHSGKILAEGPKAGSRNAGHWRYYAEDGTLDGEGDFSSGKKNGEWKYFYPSGKVSSSGSYENDNATGLWNYYFEDGSISSSGTFAGGKKNGYWNSLNKDGSTKSEITYVNGSGEYREYYPSKKLRAKGLIEDGKSNGKWQYYFEDGKTEGECDFVKGRGMYYGYYPNGTLQTKGLIEDDLRVGTWELYEQDGKLSGYYKPFYENNTLANEIGQLIGKSAKNPPTVKAQAPPIKRGFTYFKPRNPEYFGVIVAGNPMMSFIGTLPLGVEFYHQERIGHEFVFEAIRNPFFTADSHVPLNKVFNRGYAIAVRQKFYNPTRTGMWYFGHEFRFTNVGYFSNVALFQQSPGTIITASASEQRAEYGLLLGSRLMQRNHGDGLTIDAFIGYAVGYRMFDVEPSYSEVFRSVTQNKFSQSFQFGLNFGYAQSFDARRR